VGWGTTIGSGSGVIPVGLTASAEEAAVLAWLRSSMVSLRASGAAAGITGSVRVGGEGAVDIHVQVGGTSAP
jgi:hypothetical protein